jgi:hypothetical protein
LHLHGSSHFETFTGAAIKGILADMVLGRAVSVGGTRRQVSPRQLKEVIQVTHIEVGSVASLGAMVSGEFLR